MCSLSVSKIDKDIKKHWGDWMAQLFKACTFSSGHDLTVGEFEPHAGLTAVSADPASDPLSPVLSGPPQLMLSLPLLKLTKKINKKPYTKEYILYASYIIC